MTWKEIVGKCLQGYVSVEQQNGYRSERIADEEHTMLQYYLEIKTNLFNDDGNVCYWVWLSCDGKENVSPHFISFFYFVAWGMKRKRSLKLTHRILANIQQSKKNEKHCQSSAENDKIRISRLENIFWLHSALPLRTENISFHLYEWERDLIQ